MIRGPGMGRFRAVLMIGLLWLAGVGVQAQPDAFNLPAPLYVLTAEGAVQRYGLGAEGITQVTAEGEFVLDFGVGPDDTWLAYRTEDGLFLQHIYTDARISVDEDGAGVPPVRGEGPTVAWSPQGDAFVVTTEDGAQVYFNQSEAALLFDEPMFRRQSLTEGAFAQVFWSVNGQYLVGQTVENVWWVYRREADMVLSSTIPAATDAAFVNNAELVFTPPAGGLVLMDLRTNGQITLLDDSWLYAHPGLLADGRLGVFGSQKDDPNIEEGYGRLLALTPGTPEINTLSETPLILADLAWTPNGSLMTSFQGGALALVDPISGQGLSLPVEGIAAFAWGPDTVARVPGMATGADLFFIAFNDEAVAQVWRLPADGGSPVMVTNAPVSVTGFAVAPDGAQVVYSSDQRLFSQAIDEAEAVEVLVLNEDGAAQPNFSVDGQQVAYRDGGIAIVSLADGESAQIITDVGGVVYSAPRFLPNQNALLVTVSEDGVNTDVLLDPNTGEILPLSPAHQALALMDGRVVTYGQPTRGGEAAQGGLTLFQLAETADGQALLPGIAAVEAAREISAGVLRLSMPPQPDGPARLRLVDFSVQNGALTPVHHDDFLEVVTFSPDGAFVAGYQYPVNDPVLGAGGPLVVLHLPTGEQARLIDPPVVWGLTWPG
jgi:hypothetical protein